MGLEINKNSGCLFINNQWILGTGETFASYNPANDEMLWQGNEASQSQIDEAFFSAKSAFSDWSNLEFSERLQYVERYCEIVKSHQDSIAENISKETGKPLWESKTEAKAILAKLPVTVKAYQLRCQAFLNEENQKQILVRHKPHGVVAVLGPFNFPAHIPNGHILPALLAGNTVLYKPSELTPKVAELMVSFFEQAGLPKGVINLIQGRGPVGKMLTSHAELNGLFFTGSFKTGQMINETFAKDPGKILALEMGGNNPLIVHDIDNIQAAVYQCLQSVYLTSGQRCTAARRLIITESRNTNAFMDSLIKAIKKIRYGIYTDPKEPFMGPVISKMASENIVKSYEALLHTGAEVVVPFIHNEKMPALLNPALVDITNSKEKKDEEIFGPLLQLIRVKDFDSALTEANNTQYGLVAGIFCEDEKYYQQMQRSVKVGLMNWNCATTGSSSQLPFGGVKHSGNFHPAGFYSIDYCVYPMSSMEQKRLELPKSVSPGLEFALE